MQITNIIAKKRDKQELTSAEIKYFIKGYTDGSIPDYQASAWCMAILLNGMTEAEITALTLEMAASGYTLDLHHIAPFVVDKHSTGGVGDKTSLVVLPLVASDGLPVGKMSGRGLGYSGGTIDKLESITGFEANLSTAKFMAQLQKEGIAVSGQSVDLAPADGKLYALRDVTATVPSIPLIAASIMSKKIASGADAIVLDVKVGKGAFMQTLDKAEVLANLMIKIGRNSKRKVAAVLADMNQPLGHAVGNALEVKEAIDTLHGGGPPEFRLHCLTIAGKMIQLAGKADSLKSAESMLTQQLNDGTAWQKFLAWIKAQGGDIRQLENPDLLPTAPIIETVTAPQTGYIAEIDAAEIGKTCVALGGGRIKKDDTIDHSVGIVHHAKVADFVEENAPLFTVHANSEQSLHKAKARILSAITWSEKTVSKTAHILKIIE